MSATVELYEGDNDVRIKCVLFLESAKSQRHRDPYKRQILIKFCLTVRSIIHSKYDLSLPIGKVLTHTNHDRQ